MIINQAFAADSVPQAPATPAVTTQVGASAPVPPAPNTTEALMWNGAFIAVMVIMFYILLIRPQQARYREHTDMLKKLHKGDKVILQSGIIAVIDHVPENSEEMTVDLGASHKVQVMRSAIAGKYADIVKKG